MVGSLPHQRKTGLGWGELWAARSIWDLGRSKFSRRFWYNRSQPRNFALLETNKLVDPSRSSPPPTIFSRNFLRRNESKPKKHKPRGFQMPRVHHWAVIKTFAVSDMVNPARSPPWGWRASWARIQTFGKSSQSGIQQIPMCRHKIDVRCIYTSFPWL